MRASTSVLLLLIACGRDHQTVETENKGITYELHVFSPKPDPAIKILVGGKSEPFKVDSITVSFPVTAGPVLQDVAMELPTPCGPERVKLVAEQYLTTTELTAAMEEQLRKEHTGHGPIDVGLAVASTGFPSQTPVFADLATGDAHLVRSRLGPEVAAAHGFDAQRPWR